MQRAFQELQEDAAQKIEARESVLDLFMTIIQNDQCRNKFINDRSYRATINQTVGNFSDQFKKSDQIYLKRLEILKNQCFVLLKMIEKANKEGIKIL